MGIKKCNFCKGEIYPIISLGKMPLANYFPKRSEINNEKKYPLELGVCLKCSLVQLTKLIDPKIIFKKYHFLTSASNPLIKNHQNLISDIKSRIFVDKNTKILDVGCNDASLLENFGTGLKLLGVEPSKKHCEIAKGKGINVINDFFSLELARKIKKKYGTFDVITATRVLANIYDLNDFLSGINLLLNEKSLFVVEVSDFDEIMKRGEFDVVYHEHYSYFTKESIKNIFAKNCLGIYEIQKTNFQGGELRVFAKKDAKVLPKYKPIKIFKYIKFKNKVVNYKKKLLRIFENLSNKNIAIYAAPAKASTLLNYCGINSSQIKFAVDSTQFKQGKFIPGTGIKVYKEEYLKDKKIDYIFVLAWNYIDSIAVKIKKLAPKASVIVPFPRIQILSQKNSKIQK